MNADGKIVIGVELDTKEFDDDYKELQKKMKEYLSELDKLKAQKELAKFNNNQEREEDIDFRIEAVQRKIDEISQETENINAQTKGTADNAREFSDNLENVKNLDLENVIKRTGAELKKSARSIKNTILAIFGIRGIFSFIRSSLSIISSNDSQLKADIEYIKVALAYTIEPIIRTIVDWAKQLLIYIGQIVKAWTGNDIFAKANKHLDKANKQVKELKNSVAGFDELNIIKDESEEKSDASKSSLANVDLSKEKTPGWLQVLINNPGILTGVAAGLTAVKLGFDGLKAVGIGFVAAGITDIVRGIKNFIKDPSVKNFGTVTKGIGESILGIGLASKNLPLIVAGVGVSVLGAVLENWDEVKEVLGKVAGWIYDNVIKPVIDFFQKLWDTISQVISNMVSNITNAFKRIFTNIKDILNGIIMIFKGNFVEGIKSIFKGLVNTLITGLNFLIDAINLFATPVRGLLAGIGLVLGKGWHFDDIKIPHIPYLAKGAIVNNPGKGVMMGSYVAGERGREGGIPLEDPMAMEELGYAIGRNVIVNLTNINKWDSKIVGKETKKLTSDMLFLRNGGVA